MVKVLKKEKKQEINYNHSYRKMELRMDFIIQFLYIFKNVSTILGYKKGDFPVTEDLAQSGLSLPMFPELKDEQIEYIALKIKEFFQK